MRTDIEREAFARYRSIVPDWEAFCESLAEPLPVSFWTNSTKISSTDLLATLEEFPTPTPLPWRSDSFTLPPGSKLGASWQHLIGLLQIQEETSQWPVRLLDPQPGERILDLCAAPGNKTSQIALAMNHQGTLVANDNTKGRLWAMRRTLSRLGIHNVALTLFDGCNYPNTAGTFDRILVDAPCSCQGTSRKAHQVPSRWFDVAYSLRMSQTQKRLLRRAYRLCKTGGRIVYSTCTYAPEENEGVVNEILQEMGAENLRLLPIDHASFGAMEGLTSWAEQTYAPELHHAARVWPHLRNTGGFFVAVLEKTGHTPELPAPLPPTCVAASSNEWKELQQSIVERYGFSPTLQDSLAWTLHGLHNVYTHPKASTPPQQPPVQQHGLLWLRHKTHYSNLSTVAAMTWGQQATRHIVELTAEQRDDFLSRLTFAVEPHQQIECIEKGLVIVRYNGQSLGTGILRRGSSPHSATLESQFPKAWSQEFLARSHSP
ncbi:MAG: RsmB/NOP family class I SAM-dependent RNA methyltransferase [Deltaproteobacteria bacterium]|nr:MAG: RsmB/NOP family class I SAM-dependent RNA methyltransferase [Deltaproteobacteria bacterium]